MNAIIAESLEPQMRAEGLGRLQLLVLPIPDPLGTDEIQAIDWHEIESLVELRLKQLDFQLPSNEDVMVSAKSAVVRGESFALFAYRTFSNLRSEQVDPVVVGLTFCENETSISISGDISGDERGDVIFTASKKQVAKQQETVRRATNEAIDELVAHCSDIARALTDRERIVE